MALEDVFPPSGGKECMVVFIGEVFTCGTRSSGILWPNGKSVVTLAVHCMQLVKIPSLFQCCGIHCLHVLSVVQNGKCVLPRQESAVAFNNILMLCMGMIRFVVAAGNSPCG